MDSAAQAVERLRALARLVLAASLGLALLLAPPRGSPLGPVLALVCVFYFLYAILGFVFYRQLTGRLLQAATLSGDAAALGVILLVSPAQPAAFILFFLYFTLVAGLWRGWWAAAGLSAAVSSIYLSLAWRESQAEGAAPMLASEAWKIWTMGGVLVAAGTLVGVLGQRERQRAEQAAEVEELARLLSFDARWPELWQRWLRKLCQRFRARRALLAYHDPETDLVGLWQFSDEGEGRLKESDRPPRDARTFLLEGFPFSLLGNRLDSAATEAWHIRHAYSTEAGSEKKLLLPGRFTLELAPRSLLSVPLSVGGRWRGRLMLLDAVEPEFTLRDLDDLQRLMGGLGPMLANLLTVRSMIQQAVNDERDQISRSLHDGVAQTLASLVMQLDVYRRQAIVEPERTADGLGQLQDVVRQEQESLRRFVRTLKPVRVPATELNRWVVAHCAQFQQETGIEVEVKAEAAASSLPEGVCREVFLILRESLHNVRKHAEARRVRVELQQDDATLRLVVGDNGRGFPFAGTYSQAQLEEKGLLPVSVRDHTRFLGGTLSIESMPGEGATLRVEIPLN
jgi:signal transduction histidine kinase